MSYFAKDEAPAASYYGSNGQPTNDYTSQAPATTDQSPADPGTVHRQYNSTNQGTSDYLGNPPYTGPQYNSAATEQPNYDGQRQQYQSYQAQQQQPQQTKNQQYQPYQAQQQQPQQQPQQYQPYQQYPAQQQQPQAPEYQPYQSQQPITNPPAPGAASLQQNPNQYIQGFYDPNAAPATPTTSATATPPATAPQGNDAYILSPNAGTNTTGAAAYTAELPNQSPQFDGIYNPAAPTPPVQPTAAPYRPGSTGDANSYYAPVAPATPSTNGGGYNGR
tara:strand:- start:3189 stop:4016 length:828 start_codon:yes stop_codon:yes gene_type:complete